jgi:hypothetical protein
MKKILLTLAVVLMLSGSADAIVVNGPQDVPEELRVAKLYSGPFGIPLGGINGRPLERIGFWLW